MPPFIENQKHAAIDHVRSLYSQVEPGEMSVVASLSANGFFLMLAYYLLKPVRESMLLSTGGAELRSYAVGLVALVLLFAVPLITCLLRRMGEQAVSRCFTVTGILSLTLFSFLDPGITAVGLAFFIWLGIFGVILVAQFWNLATHLYANRDGHRIFPIIAIGVALGAFTGSLVSAGLLRLVGEHAVMLMAAIVLAAAQLFADHARHLARPVARHCTRSAMRKHLRHSHGGLRTVLRDSYLLLFAVSMILLNCINSIGEYILAEIVVGYAHELSVQAVNTLPENKVIGAVYGRYYMWINLLGLMLQLFIVTRVFRSIGIGRAALILPMIMIFGYIMIGIVPIVSVVSLYLVIENSANYSLHNTVRHVLFLSVDKRIKHQAKTTIDTFFWRMGDLLQVVVVFGGLHWLGFGIRGFILINIFLATILLKLTLTISRTYRDQPGEESNHDVLQFPKATGHEASLLVEDDEHCGIGVSKETSGPAEGLSDWSAKTGTGRK